MQPKRPLSLLRAQEEGAQRFESYRPVVMLISNPLRVNCRRRGNGQGWNGIAGVGPQALLREADLALPIYVGHAPQLYSAIA